MPSSRPDLRRTAPLAADAAPFSDKVAAPIMAANTTIGQQRIDSTTAVPIDFFVLVDARGRNATDAPPPDSPPAPADEPPAASAVSPADDTTLS